MPHSVIEEIKNRLDIVELVNSYIRLQKAGANYRALCPFHREKTPSFNVSPARQIWHCFGCGLGGDHFKFVMQIEGLEFPDALELLAKRAGVQLRREDPNLRSERSRLLQLVEDATRLFEAALHHTRTPEQISPPKNYLKQRGLNNETMQAWRIGYAPNSWDFAVRALRAKGYRESEIEKAGLAVRSEQGSYYDRFRNRIMFPVADTSGRVVGFSGRIFDQIPGKTVGSIEEKAPAKYINSPQTLIYDKSKVLFGYEKARQEIARCETVVLVEGQMDAVMSHQAGVKNTVAVSGTALTADQLKTLRRIAKTLIGSFDRDTAGEMATKRSMDLAAAFGFERKVAALPDGYKDPADAVLKDPKLWEEAVSSAEPLVQYFLAGACTKYDRGTASGKRQIAETVLPEIKLLTSEIERAYWIQTLAREIAIPEEALWRELKGTKISLPEIRLTDADHAPKAPPDRRAQLESLLVGLILIDPAAVTRKGGLPPPELIIDAEHRAILQEVERMLASGVTEPKTLIEGMTGTLREQANTAAFHAEVVIERIENQRDRANEFETIRRELEREWAREKLSELSREIREAEQLKAQDRLQALLGEFRKLTEKFAQ